jgi:hypothetical protein
MPEIGGDLAPNGAGNAALAARRSGSDNPDKATIVVPPCAVCQVGLGPVASDADPERSRRARRDVPPHIPQPPAEPKAVVADRSRCHRTLAHEVVAEVH